jgi:hypothetical protein
LASLPRIEASAGALPRAFDPLPVLLELGKRARVAASREELAFILVNDTRQLLSYRQAALWFRRGGLETLSGVIQPEANAPYAQWLNRVCRALSEKDAGQPFRVTDADLPRELVAEWKEWLPAEVVWVPVTASDSHPGSSPGGLLLAADMPFGHEALALLGEWMHAWRHAWLALFRPSAWPLAPWRRTQQRKAWWRHRTILAALAVLLFCALPVRITVVAPGELVPADPAVIRAPLDGVIGEFQVHPNESVTAGQPLLSFDEAALASRLTVARQALATARAEYRQAAQLALSDPKSKAELATLVGKIGERRAEADFLSGQLERSHILAPRDGIVIFDDPSEWIGRPVQTGERIMRIADPHDVEIEAWIPIGDAIPLQEGAAVSLYLASDPFASVTAKLRYLNHDASPRPEGVYAYRARAVLDAPTRHRIGLKGTAKLYGGWVPLGYWVLRRPLAAIRQFLAM